MAKKKIKKEEIIGGLRSTLANVHPMPFEYLPIQKLSPSCLSWEFVRD